MKIKDIRKLTRSADKKMLTQEQFSEKYNIPMNTLNKWEAEITVCPPYVNELLEFKVRYDEGLL